MTAREQLQHVAMMLTALHELDGAAPSDNVRACVTETMALRNAILDRETSAGVVPADTGAGPEQPHSVEGVRSGDQPGPASEPKGDDEHQRD